MQQDLKISDAMFESYEARREAAKSLLGFCLVYLPQYFYLEPAEFHRELFAAIENPANRFLEIIGFRGSSKSTIGSLALPLWAALEKSKQYPFILPMADTALQSGTNIANIKNELEHNDLIRQDYGAVEAKMEEDLPSLESEEEWQSKNMLLSNGVRILGRSRGQKVRGLRHLEHRPKLVIVDDPEDLEWVRKKENRDKTERWLKGEVLPGMDELTGRIIVIGNLLNNDALMARIKNDPHKIFQVIEFPLLKGGRCTWPAKYPSQEALDQQRHLVGETSWQREYLLKVVPIEGQEVKDEWIRYYDKLPESVSRSAVGVDLAISKKETADYTAMVGGVGSMVDGLPKIFILPHPINERLSFHETIQQMKSLQLAIGKYSTPLFLVEDVAYQRAAVEEAQRQGVPVEAIRPGADKRARLRAAATFIQNGTVLFPRMGTEDLISQLTGFGVEDHDDLVDAIVYLILGMSQQGLEMPKVVGLL